ncbi:TPA: type III secretion system effector cysteine methyltransferase OspZ, partial [Escherichia coli]|nr:type III secretion system effector cysteine methyltransferase OspZ [Escherichia coli]EFL6502106.1 type III secretion system effector cysteine methyltransferase OspZ [Escherichia coli]
RRLNYMKTMYSPCPEDFQPISRDEASTPEGSWLTVISGKRPMGQFSVDSLYHPDLHALCELPEISCKIFPKENSDFLYIIVVFRNDSPQGELRANRFIELYDIKREIMQVLRDESPELKSIKSEIIIAREMGELFSYASEEIDSYIKQMNDRLSQIKARMPVT